MTVGVIHVPEYYKGYKIYYSGDYPCISIAGKVLRIHILEMEKKLGRKLKPCEVVHHIDEDKHNYAKDNLMCFASVADHTAFHKGCEVAFDDEGVAYCPEKAIHVEGKSGTYNKCPICGKLKTQGSSICQKCYKSVPISSKNKFAPKSMMFNEMLQEGETIDECMRSQLLKDIKTITSITMIAEKYGVSRATIKKWLNQCNIKDTPASIRLPEKSELEQLLSVSSTNAVAKMYGVDRKTLLSWMSKLGIQYTTCSNRQQVKCKTSNEIFISIIHAAKSKYPEFNPKSASKYIKRACEQNTDYKGLYWEFV